LAFSPVGGLLATGLSDGTVRLWDGGTGLEKTLPRAGSVLVFSPDGRWLAIGSTDGTVRLWDSASGQQARVLEHRERSVLWTTEMAISHLAFSPDGTKLAVASNEEDDGRVALWELL
jgi:WD40 repeat protein